MGFKSTTLNALRELVRFLKRYREAFVLVLTPLLLYPLPSIYPEPEARCGYVIILMAVFWVTEAVPVPITALIPVFAFPLLGILSTEDVCMVYMKETNMMFLGGLTVAIAVEHCNLHRRIALGVILLVGQSPRSLMAGFMLTTMFLSMWISNTATTAMMVPIVDAILAELYAHRESQLQEAAQKEHAIEMDLSIAPAKMSQMDLVAQDSTSVCSDNPDCCYTNEAAITTTTIATTTEATGNNGIAYHRNHHHHHHSKEDEANNTNPNTTAAASGAGVAAAETAGELDITASPLKTDPTCRALRDMCFLATAYSANIGGTGSLTGTGPNLVLKGVLSSSYSEPTGLNFLSWMMFNVPGMIICVVLAWLWLQIKYLGLFGKKTALGEEVPEERKRAVKKLIQQKYDALGRIKFQELVVLVLFVILVMLWLFREPEFIPGWAHYFEDAFGVVVDDATPAMLIVFLLFCLPARLDFWCFRKRNDPPRDPHDKNEVLTWRAIQEKIPWGVVLLLGGGFAMAEGSKASGLSKWLGDQLYIFNGVNKAVIVLVVTLLTAMFTEVASNSATASIILPVLNELALNINVNPLYLMVPATVCCSYAFMLPVATPPNAIVFSVAEMKSRDMMRVGIVMNIVCVLVLNVMINTLGVVVFDLNTMPAWTNSSLTETV